MKQKNYIEELQNNQPLKIEFIYLWLKENTTNFYKAIEETECHKWKKWQRDNSIHVFPCVCPTRNYECVFIEVYRGLDKFIQATKTEGFYKKLLEQFYKIQHNQNAVFEWIKDVEQYGNELLSIYSKISIEITAEPYYCEFIQLNKTELQNLWKFQEIFNQYYYSEEYKKYISH